MLAHQDENLNTTYSWALGPAAFAPPPAVPYIVPILEPAFAPFANFYGAKASVYAAPVLIPTAANFRNPWDYAFGPIGAGAGVASVPASNIPPQTGTTSMA